MNKLKIYLLSLILLLSLSTGVRAEYFSDVIVTSPNGIWTDSRAYTSLTSAVAAVGAVNQRTIVIASPHTVGNITISSNITLKFERDGAIANTGQLTLNTKNIIADNRQIFTGAGDIDFASGTIVKSGWFGTFESAVNLTSDDTITLIVTKAQTLTSSQALGNNVILKWESPGNILTAGAGVTISNIGQVEAGKYQIFAGAGNFRFRDGTLLNLSWFANLRAAITHASTNKLTLLVQDSYTVDLSASIPSTLTTKFVQGGSFAISPGITLTFGGPVEAGLYQVFNCVGTGKVVFGSVPPLVYAEWWYSGSGDAYAAIQAAITAANGNAPVQLTRASYSLSAGLTPTVKTEIVGGMDGFVYGIGASRTELKWTGGTTGIDQSGVALPYFKLANITINGNSVLSYGVKGGYFTTFENVGIIGCTVAGYQTGSDAQGGYYRNSSFNGNYNGVVFGGGTTQLFDHCVARQNTNYGMTGNPGNQSSFVNQCIWENNTLSGLNLVGAMKNVHILDGYYEQNNAAAGAGGYHVLAAITGDSDNIVFDNTMFGSTTTTKIANVTDGKIIFRYSRQTGSRLTPQITVTDGAEVIIEQSFYGYPMPAGVKVLPDVAVTVEQALNFTGTSFLDINALGLTLGAGDFTVSMTFANNWEAQVQRCLLSGDIHALTIGLSGTAYGQYGINFYDAGSVAFHTTVYNFVYGVPYTLLYSRISGIGYLYINGYLVDSFADTTNYSGAQRYVARYITGPSYGNSDFYALSFFSAGLTNADAIQLWRYGGDPILAGVTANMTFNLDPSVRPSGQIRDTVTGTMVAMSGSAVWRTPTYYFGSATWNPGWLNDGVGETSASITVTGAALGDFVVVSAPYDLQGVTCNGYVDAINSVKIRLQNETGGVVDLASGTWKARVLK